MTPKDQVSKVLGIQKTSKVIGAIMVPMLVWFSLNAAWPVAGFLWWTLYLVLCFACCSIFFTVAFTAAVFYVAATNMSTPIPPDGLEETEEVSEVTATTISIEGHSEQFGTLGGTPLFEWIDAIIPGFDGVTRCTFETTVSGEVEQSLLPEKCIVVPPGVVYRLP